MVPDHDQFNFLEIIRKSFFFILEIFGYVFDENMKTSFEQNLFGRFANFSKKKILEGR